MIRVKFRSDLIWTRAGAQSKVRVRTRSRDQTQDLAVSLIKHKFKVQYLASLCDKVRIQNWRCHLVNLGDLTPTSSCTPNLFLHLRAWPSEKEMGKLRSLAGLSPLSPVAPRVPSGGTP